MNWSSLPDSSTIWGHNENGINQEDGHANDVSLPDDQETRELPYTDHITHDHQDAAVDFMQFVDIPEQDAEEESYSIGSLDEEDMAKLADSVDQPPRQTPPTSVMREISSISSAGTYDPTLQRSSPANNPPESTEEEELLDSDIDWTPIMDQLATQANLHPLDQSVSQPAVATVSRNPRGLQHAPFRECTLPPFTRPPFPQRLRDKSPICGLSNTTVLRTCFRLGHLIAENIHNSSHNQDAVYELYARVNYSHRNRPSSTQIPLFNAVKHDNSARMQLFQFVDLWKDTKPYVWGVLENWRPDGALNKQSGVFLSAGPPPSQFTDNNDAQHEKKMCRCICRISKAPKGESQGGGRSKRNNPEIGGWVMKVLWIEEIGWDMIEKMKAIICHE
ncbi:hypothetical protein QBC36DRAFT_385942 [Triangularia setosa]|uniref:Uncharacterized protein n=1 Tax=Triangularia setosa TaxID=2587417 RepID=A0AAN6WD73_9PEZI|nr:hypothetical protein QBC36DRAFT_385942 [Podospora setosa]